MKKLLLAAALCVLAAALCVLAAPAYAQSCTIDSSGNTFCDPASFHITDSLATGSDPVLLNEATTFNVDEINNDTIDSPLTVYFAVPTSDTTMPVVTKYDYNGGPFGVAGVTLTSLGTWTPTNGKGGDLYSFVGCANCDASINEMNVDAVDGVGTTFKVFSLTINQGFTNKGVETIDGSFPIGTLIAPLAEDIVVQANGKTKTTFYDTSWTNTGDINKLSVSTPEPSTWAMMLLGFAGLGFAGYRKAHSARTALSAA
jgi:hypothetical protein